MGDYWYFPLFKTLFIRYQYAIWAIFKLESVLPNFFDTDFGILDDFGPLHDRVLYVL